MSFNASFSTKSAAMAYAASMREHGWTAMVFKRSQPGPFAKVATYVVAVSW
jgi:hypothetical protein